MKKILLSSAAIVAFAGAASAEVTWSGDAELGYNDDFRDGAYWDAGLFVNLSQELNNGWTASASLDVDVTGTETPFEESTSFDLGDTDTSDWVLSLSNDMFSLSFGDTATAFESFKQTPKLLDNYYFAIETGDDYDDLFDDTTEGNVLVTFNYGSFSGAVSYALVEDGEGDGEDGDLQNGQYVLNGDFDTFSVGAFYAEDGAYDYFGEGADFFGISAGTTLGGVELSAVISQLSFDDEDSTGFGLEVAYPVGPVTLGAYYAQWDDAEDGGFLDDSAYGVSVDYVDGPLTVSAYYDDAFGWEEYGIGGAYDFGMGLVVTAGYIDGDNNGDDDFATYVVAEYDLGGGASFLASYADANSDAAEMTDDIDTVTGGYELYSGATLSLTFSF